MIKNKLKINDSKTEFIIFRSPLLKQNLSDLSVNVGDTQFSPSSKVRDLGVVFDQYLNFHDHISGICKSTHFHLRGIGRIRNLLTFDATAQLIHAAPNDASYKRWSCHSGLKLLYKLCRTSPPPAMGSRFTVFWACRPCGPTGRLALRLTKAGDVETNPGPTTLNKKVWICDICH